MNPPTVTALNAKATKVYFIDSIAIFVYAQCMHLDKKKLIKAPSVIFVIASLFLFASFVKNAYAGYMECETGQYTACNTNGSKTGHWMYVSQNSNGSYSCNDQGQYRCNLPYWGNCGNNGVDKCWAGMPGTKPSGVSATQLSGLYTYGSGACGVQATFSPAINSNAALYCVCGVPGAAACPAPSPTIPPATQAPTQAPTQGPTQPSAPPTVSLSVVLGLPGIGYNGNAPVHTKRTATIELYDPSVTNPGGPGTKPLASQAITLEYQTTGNSAGYFAAQSQTFTLPSNPQSGNNYQILVKVPQFLYKLETSGTNASNPTIFTLSPSASVTLPILYMDPGDLVTANGGANLLNLDDYTQLKTCFGSSSSCPTTTDGIPVADLNDDGSVSIVDFNIMLRSLANFINNESSHCNGLECQGD